MKDLICKNILKVVTINNEQNYTIQPPDGCRGILFSFNESVENVRFYNSSTAGSAPFLDQKINTHGIKSCILIGVMIY